MATWDELESFTWGDLNSFTWDQVERLTISQLVNFRDRAWPAIANLSAADLNSLREGIVDGSLPPALLADGLPRYTRVQQIALHIWTTVIPHDRAEVIAYIAILLTLVGIAQTAQQSSAPDVVVIINELPPEIRPELPSPDPRDPSSPPDAPQAA